MREYELVVVLNPRMDQDQVNAAMERIHRIVAQNGGEITERNDWGMRRLAYPIKHMREGNYILTRFNMDPQRTRAVEDNLRISEEVLRHLMVRAEA